MNFKFPKEKFVKNILDFIRYQDIWDVFFVSAVPMKFGLKNNLTEEKLNFELGVNHIFLDYELEITEMPLLHIYCLEGENSIRTLVTKKLKGRLKELDLENRSNEIFQLINEFLV